MTVVARSLIRRAIDEAVLIPFDQPTIETDEEAPRHLQRHFAERLPISFFGFARAGPTLGERLAVYRDCNGLPRCFDLAEHDATAIASLFAGDTLLLSRLWPSRRRRWNPIMARETLLTHQARVGTKFIANALGPFAESAAVKSAHLAIGQLAERLLWRGADPYAVLDIARGWNETRGNGALSDDIVLRIVDAACARQLSRQEQRHAG